MIKIQNYINGKLQVAKSGNWLDNTNPATGLVYSLIPDSDKNDVEDAYKAAEKAFPLWSAMTVKERSDIMLKISERIEANLEELAIAETNDNGKPLWLSRSVDIPRASKNFSFFATAVLHRSSEAHHTNQVALNYTHRKPLGVVGCISPWNLPLYLFTWKIAPALASGNCVVAKPSEVTPMTAYLLSKLCIEAGLPKGVLNIVHGLGHKAGSEIVSHPNIKAISFTGGTETGKAIASIAAPMFKKLSLELGGKNPNIIFDDCDFEEAVKQSLRSSFSNQGEICLCGSRIFVHEKIYNKFRDAFIAGAAKLKVGDPLEENSRQGAIVSKAHFEKIQSYIKLAKEEGGKISFGGKVVKLSGRCESGFFLEPTIIEGLANDCRVNQEEIFGPVVSLIPFKSEAEVLSYANDSVYGLASILWTNDLKRAHRMAHALQSGIVWVNCWLLRDLRTPFGGVKQSGVGREGGNYALDFFTEAKNICIQL